MDKEYTADQAYSDFVNMWKTLAKTGISRKTNIIAALNWHNNCPLCHYLRMQDIYITSSNCLNYCLVNWPGSHCQDPESPYYKWEGCLDINNRRKLAAKIWRLPRRDKNDLS